MTEAEEQQSPPRRGRRKLLLYAVLYVALFAACAFALWQALLFLHPPVNEHAGKIDTSARGGRKDEFGDGFVDPFRAVGLRPVSAQPPVDPPFGAEPVRAVGGNESDLARVYLIWSYRVAAPRQAVEKHYRREFQAEGFAFLSSREVNATKRLLKFQKKDSTVIVGTALRKPRKNAKIECSISVVQFRREEAGDFLPDFETEIPLDLDGFEE